MWDYIEFWLAKKLAEFLFAVIILGTAIALVVLIPIIGYYIRKIKRYFKD